MTDHSDRLRTVLDRLPFSVDDVDAVNEAFRRWKQEQDPEAERLVDMWTYCYVCRYFLAKSTGDAFNSAVAVDELIMRTYEQIQENRDGVRDPDRYSNWVSVVCKNTFLNYTRRERVADSIDDEQGSPLQSDRSRIPEIGLVREAFAEAIDRLPSYLQEPARLYFLEDRQVEEISEEIGKSVATVRKYTHKVVKKLREDEKLQEIMSFPKRPRRNGSIPRNEAREMVRAVHVVPRTGTWIVIKSGEGNVEEEFNNKGKALSFARSLRRDHDAKLIVHDGESDTQMV